MGMKSAYSIKFVSFAVLSSFSMSVLAVGNAYTGAVSASSSEKLTAGWRNNGLRRYELPKPTKLLWSAPYDEGLDAFLVSWNNGAAGKVRIVDTRFGKGLEILKTNDIGSVCIRPKKPFNLPPGMRTKCFAAMSSQSYDFEFAYGVLRVGAVGNESQIPHGESGIAVAGAMRMRGMPNTAPNAYEEKYAFGDSVKDGECQTTSITISGAASHSVWSAWRIEDAEAAIVAVKENVTRKPFIKSHTYNSEMIPEDIFNQKIATDVEHSANVRMKDGFPRFFIDGTEQPLVLYRSQKGAEDGVVRFAGGSLARSVPLMVFPINFRGVPPRRGLWNEEGFDVDVAVEEVRKGMRCAADSMFVLAIGLSAYPTFTTRHPNETWRTEEGRLVCGNFNLANKTIAPGETPPKGYWPWVSYHSQIWREQVKTNLTILVRALKDAGLSKRIVGIHLFGFHDGQFAVERADYSTPAIEAYRRWTGRADAMPPPMKDKPVFDPDIDKENIEWIQFQKRAPFAMLEDLSRHLRSEFAKDLIFFRWCMWPLGDAMRGAWDITPFVESDTFDVIVPQPTYPRRAPAIPNGIVMPYSSINRNGKLFLFEFDLRTWGMWSERETEMRDAGVCRARDLEEWCSIHRKLAGEMFARHCGFWYYDMAESWFRPTEISNDIEEVLSFARKLAARKPSLWRPQVAFVIDEESLFRANLSIPHGDIDYDKDVKTSTGRPNIYMLLLGQLNRLAASGVPFDVYLAKDFDSDPALAATYRYVVRRITDSDKYIMPDEFNAKARALGAYVPVGPNKVEVNMNGDFLCVHALTNGTFDFKLPFPCKVRNVKSGELERVSGDAFKLSVEAGQTCWFLFEQ